MYPVITSSLMFLLFPGTDEEAIINVVSNRSNQQRQDIKRMFKTMYGKVISEFHDLTLTVCSQPAFLVTSLN